MDITKILFSTPSLEPINRIRDYPHMQEYQHMNRKVCHIRHRHHLPWRKAWNKIRFTKRKNLKYLSVYKCELHSSSYSNSKQHILSWETNSSSHRQVTPQILWNPNFITVFTITRHLLLFWATSIQSTSGPTISLWSILILYSHLCLRLSRSSVPQVTLHTPFVHFPSRPTFHTSRPAHNPEFDIRLIFGEKYKTRSSSLCDFLKYLLTSSPLRLK